MSYLELEDGIPDFSKVVISLWFRVPTQSLEDTLEEAKRISKIREGLSGDAQQFFVYPRFHGILPLLTFGPLRKGYQLKSVGGPEQTYTISYMAYINCGWRKSGDDQVHTTNTGAVYKKIADYLPNPSFIGVEVAEVNDELVAMLRIRLQMSDNGKGKAMHPTPVFKMSNHTVQTFTEVTEGCPPAPSEVLFSFGGFGCIRDEFYPGGERVRTNDFRDDTELWTQKNGPEAFETGDIGVKPDRWHHLLFSCDLEHQMKGEGSKSVTTYPPCVEGQQEEPVPEATFEKVKEISDPCKAWISFDDANQIKDKIYRNNTASEIKGLGDNTIVPDNIFSAAGYETGRITPWRTWSVTGLIDNYSYGSDIGMPTYEYSPKLVPSSKAPLGIPAAASLVEYIRHVEMAELQIFTGVTLDTAKDDNRRAFISDKGKPVNPEKAKELLKKEPVVLLNKSSNWIAGRNTATEKPNPDDDFEPTGDIERYTPGPSLHGPQKPGEKP